MIDVELTRMIITLSGGNETFVRNGAPAFVPSVVFLLISKGVAYE